MRLNSFSLRRVIFAIVAVTVALTATAVVIALVYSPPVDNSSPNASVVFDDHIQRKVTFQDEDGKTWLAGRVDKTAFKAILKNDYVGIYSTQHFDLRYLADMGDLYAKFLPPIANQFETSYQALQEQLGVSLGKDERVTVYMFGNDLHYLATLDVESLYFSDPDNLVIVMEFDGGSCTHELIHVLMDKGRRSSALPAEFDFEREHLLISMYAYWLDHDLFPDTQHSYDLWMRYADYDYLLNVKNAESVYAAITSDWSLPTDSKESIGWIYVPLFHYLVATQGPGVFPRLLKHTADDNYPWDVLDTKPKVLAERARSWLKTQPTTFASKWQRIMTSAAPVSLSNLSVLRKNDLAAFDRFNYYSEIISSLDYGTDKLKWLPRDSERAQAREMFIAALKQAVNELPDERKKDSEEYYEIIKNDPRQSGYALDTDIGRKIVEYPSAQLAYRIKKSGKNDGLLLEYLRSYLAKSPYDLDALVAYYSMCQGKEKEEIGIRILRHPSVMLSWAVFQKVTKKEPELLKLALKLRHPEPLAILNPVNNQPRNPGRKEAEM